MHRLNELAAQLTPEQVREVEDFAEFLIRRRGAATATTATAGPVEQGSGIRFEGWAGCLKEVEPEKSDRQLVREAWEHGDPDAGK
jgi:hypothetical protein